MSRFNSLKRGQGYVFVFGTVDCLTAVFHEILPDGVLKVAKNNQTYYLNPDRIIYVRAA